MEDELAEVVETTPSQEEASSTALQPVFGTLEPAGVLAKATNVADLLVPIIEKKQLYKVIGQKKHVYCDGWTTMAAMLGVFPHTEYCRRIEREGEIVYEARVILRHMSGNNVGSGEALCSSLERNWAGRDEYAIKSMAQTRAVGKACRLSFSWVMVMCGYEPTPAEEMVDDRKVEMPKAKAPETPVAVPDPEPPKTQKITEKQHGFLRTIWRKSGASDQQLEDLTIKQFGVKPVDLTWKQLDWIVERLEK